MASSIKLGPSFFTNEMRVYRDWALAFWRENFQNSVDAKSSSISITTLPVVNGVMRIIFEDDGEGMSRDILENVYFILGETSKNWEGGGNTGGFGKARILTCFAQERYELHTGYLMVKGSGSEYNIEDVKEYQSGVKLTVDVIVNRNGRETDMLEKLRTYLAYSYIPCKVFINGERWKNWTYNRNHRRSLSFGEVYTNNSKEAGVIVRVNGTLMFIRHSMAPTQIVVEINPYMSRKVLLANRDGLVDEFQDELDSFITELQINKLSALKPKHNNKSTTYNGTGTFRIQRKGKKDDLGAVDRNMYFERPENAIAALQSVAVQHKPIIAHGNDIEIDVQQKKAKHNIFDIVIEDMDVRNPKVRAVIGRYDPENWDFVGESRMHKGVLKIIRRGTENYKLLKIWKAACEFALQTLVNEFDEAPLSVNWGVGFVFSDTIEAGQKHVNGTSYLMINPVDSDGNMRYSITQKNDLVFMLTLAIHEVVHVVYGYHDEDFARMMTMLTAKVMLNLNEAINCMREAKEGV